MKALWIALSMAAASPAMARVVSYECKSSTYGRGVLNIIDTKYAEPRVDFYPDASTGSGTDAVRGSYSAYFSDLRAHRSGKYVALQEKAHFGVVKTYNTVQFESGLLDGARNVHVVETKKTVAALSKKVLSTKVNHFHCALDL